MFADTVRHRGREFISVTVPHRRSPSENTHSYREGKEWQDDRVIIHGWTADEHTQKKNNNKKTTGVRRESARLNKGGEGVGDAHARSCGQRMITNRHSMLSQTESAQWIRSNIPIAK